MSLRGLLRHEVWFATRSLRRFPRGKKSLACSLPPGERAAGTPHPRRSALTLIELVVALVLASIMLTALLRIVSVVSIETRQLRSQQFDRLAAGRLASRLRRDVINARGIVADRNEIRLAGYVNGDQRPGMISYTRANVGARRVLLRRSGDQTEFCWVGFGGFAIEATPADDLSAAVDGAAGLPSIPPRLQITAFDDRGRTLFSEVVRHHEE